MRLILYFFTLALAAGYLYFGLFPGPLDDRVISEINDRYGYKIRFTAVHYLPFRGFRIKNAEIEPTQQLPNGFYADTLFILPEWRRLLNKEISIKRIFAKNAYLNFSTPPDIGPENSESVGSAASGGFLKDLGKSSSDIPFPLAKTDIECSQCTVLLPENNPTGLSRLTAVDFKLSLINPDMIPIQLSMKIGNDIKVRSLKGLYKPASGQISIYSNGYLSDLPAVAGKFLDKQPLELTSVRGLYNMESAIDLPNLESPNLTARFKISFDEIQLAGQTQDFEFKSLQQLTVNGFIDNKSAVQIETANILIKETKVTSEKLTSPILITGGLINYKNKGWEISDAALTWENSEFSANLRLNGSPLIASGEIIQTSRTLNMWKPFFPDSFEGPIDFDSLTAELSTRIVIDGPLADFKQNIRSIQLTVLNGSVFLKHPVSHQLNQISGKIEVKDRQYQFSKLQFKCNGRPFTLTGLLDKSGLSKSRFEVKSQDIKVNIDALWQDASFLLNNVRIKAPGLTSDFKGMISDYKSGALNIEGTANVVSHELKRTFKDLGFKNNLSALPVGTMDADFNLSGILSDVNTLDGHIRIKSPFITVMNFPLQSVEIDADILGKVLDIPYLKGILSGGEVRGKGQIDFALENRPYFQFHAFADEVDLAQFITWAGIDYRKAEGTLNLDAALEGYLNQTRTISGSGHFRILGGTIWETDRYSKLGTIPFLRIDGINNVIFRSADGTFTVKDGKIISEDIVLNSRHIDLHLRGVMEIGGLLDLDLISRFSPSLIRETQQLGNVASTVMRMAEEKISQYKVLGTLSEPVIEENG